MNNNNTPLLNILLTTVEKTTPFSNTTGWETLKIKNWYYHLVFFPHEKRITILPTHTYIIYITKVIRSEMLAADLFHAKGLSWNRVRYGARQQRRHTRQSTALPYSNKPSVKI